jgi:hypothetical protein
MLPGRLHSRRNPTYGVVRILDVPGLCITFAPISEQKAT